MVELTAGEAAHQNELQEYYPKDRKAMMNAPGLVSIAGLRGYYPGCLCITFSEFNAPSGLGETETTKFHEKLNCRWPAPAIQLNKFFELYGNMTIVDFRVDNEGNYHVFVTTQLEREDLEDLQFAGEELERIMSDRKSIRAKERDEAKEKEEAQRRDDAFLLDLGRKARDHNIVGRFEKLEAENKKFRKMLVDLGWEET